MALERVCKQGQASTPPPQYIADMLECHNCWALPPQGGQGQALTLDPTFESFTLLELVSH